MIGHKNQQDPDAMRPPITMTTPDHEQQGEELPQKISHDARHCNLHSFHVVDQGREFRNHPLALRWKNSVAIGAATNCRDRCADL